MREKLGTLCARTANKNCLTKVVSHHELKPRGHCHTGVESRADGKGNEGVLSGIAFGPAHGKLGPEQELGEMLQ